jgi:hypothetical protein
VQLLILLVFGEVLRENGEEGEAAGSVGGGETLVWGNVHGLASLVKIQRLPGDQEVQRTVEQTGGLKRGSWHDMYVNYK